MYARLSGNMARSYGRGPYRRMLFRAGRLGRRVLDAGIPDWERRLGRFALRQGQNAVRSIGRAFSSPARSRKRGRPAETPVRGTTSGPRGSRRVVTVFNTKGYPGKLKPRKKVAPISKFLRNGSFLKREVGGEYSDNIVGSDPAAPGHIVYFGHTTAVPEELLSSVSRALVRALVRRAGFEFSSWSETLPCGNGGWILRFTYYTSSAIGELNTATTVSLNATNDFALLATRLNDKMTEVLAAGYIESPVTRNYQTSQMPLFEALELLSDDNTAGGTIIAQNREIARMKLTDVDVYVKVTSKLTFQNRTVAKTSVVDDKDETLVGNVENNPLSGRRYMYNGNHVLFRANPYGGVTSRDLCMLQPRKAQPTFTWVPGGDNSVRENLEFQKVPKSASFLNCTKSQTVYIKPGEMKTSHLTYSKSCSIQSMFKMLRQAIVSSDVQPLNPTISTRCMAGITEMIALSKTMDTRAPDEPNIQIGFECEQTFAAYVVYKQKRAAVQIVDYDTSQRNQTNT